MKKVPAFLLCVLLCISLIPGAFAEDGGKADRETSLTQEPRDFRFETDLALKLKQLGLFRGFEESGDGAADFELDRQATRVQAVAMLVRMLGKETEAAALPRTHPFTDVPAWADGYVSYAYEAGLIKGVSGTRFDAEEPVTAEMYLTLMLRALGYQDGGYGAEFSWDSPWALASHCGILPVQLDGTSCLRADLVDVTCAALYAHGKGNSVPLKDALSREGAFTQAQFDAAFPQDPFAEYRRIDRQVSAAIAQREKLGQLEFDRYAAECHTIVAMDQENGVITVKPMVFYYEATLLKDDTLGTNGGGAGPWLIKLDAKTLACLECHTAQELAAQGLSWEDILPGKTACAGYLSKGMDRVCRMETQLLLDSRAIGYRQPTYEEALTRARSYLDQITQTIETDSCTILEGSVGTPHGNAALLYLVYKPGSAVGEGETVFPPLSPESVLDIASQPDVLRLSEDGQTLQYSYHYGKPLVFEEGTSAGHILRQAGTYCYTTDLNTGKTSLSILPE